MSLLSRFRKTVIPSSYRSKKSTNSDDVHHNYRKPTKSFNEKSVKSRSSSHSFANSFNDDIPAQQQPQYSKQKSLSRNCNSTNNKSNNNKPSKLSTLSSLTKSAKAKPNNGYSIDSGTLTRSDTFTLEEENQMRNGTYPRLKKQDTYHDNIGKGKQKKQYEICYYMGLFETKLVRFCFGFC